MKTTIFLALTLLLVSCGKNNNSSSNTGYSLSAMQSNGVTIELQAVGYSPYNPYGGNMGMAIVRCVGSASYGYGYGYGNTGYGITNQQRISYLQGMQNLGGLDVNGGRIGPQTLNMLIRQAINTLSSNYQCQSNFPLAQIQNSGY